MIQILKQYHWKRKVRTSNIPLRIRFVLHHCPLPRALSCPVHRFPFPTPPDSSLPFARVLVSFPPELATIHPYHRTIVRNDPSPFHPLIPVFTRHPIGPKSFRLLVSAPFAFWKKPHTLASNSLLAFFQSAFLDIGSLHFAAAAVSLMSCQRRI